MAAVTLAAPHIVRDVLVALRTAHPEWSLDMVVRFMRSMTPRRIRELAIIVGFPATERSITQRKSPKSTVYIQYEPGEITLGLSDDRCSVTSPSHCVAEKMPTRRSVSKEQGFVSRQVTRVGQFSYRGQIYTIGASYRHQLITLSEIDNHLVIALRDGSQRRLALRPRSEERRTRTVRPHASRV
jgi:hypothetical protein